MPRTFKVTYRAVKKTDEMEIKAFSKYDAKRRFQCTELARINNIINEAKENEAKFIESKKHIKRR